MRSGSLNARGEREGILAVPRRVRMIRRISTKLVLAVLTAVVLPFVVYAFYMSERMASWLERRVVQQALTAVAGNVADQIDYFVLERHQDLELRLDEEPPDLALVEIEDIDGDGFSDLRIAYPNRIDEPGVTPPVRLELYLSGEAR